MMLKHSRQMKPVNASPSQHLIPAIYPTESGKNWLERTRTDTDRRKGLFVVLGIIILLFSMGSLISIDSATIARGTVRVDGSYKSVQHLEGGIVKEILVAEGDSVEEGDPLILMNDLQSSKKYEDIQSQMALTIAQKNRWETVQSDGAAIEFDQWLLQQNSTEVDSIIEQQTRLFNSNLKLFTTEVAVLDAKGKKTLQRQQNENVRFKNVERQLSAVETELKDYTRLKKQGLVTRSAMFDIEQQRNDLLLRLDEIEGAIAESDNDIEQFKLELNNLATARLSNAEKQLEIIENELRSLERESDVLKDTVNRAVVRAPVSGDVFNLAIFTTGGIVQPGQVMMDIVPNNGNLVVEAQIDSASRDSIQVGQTAQIKFMAFNQLKNDPYEGTVTSISAASQTKPGASTPYFSAIVEVKNNSTKSNSDVPVFPGMLAEVLIITGERTPIDYILSPISDSFNRALRE